MHVPDTRQANPIGPHALLSRPHGDQRCGVLVVGFARRDVFVPTEVCISADTLCDEDAIRAWLAQHDIRFVVAPINAGAPQGASRVAGGP
jgi:hypothetical protein